MKEGGGGVTSNTWLVGEIESGSTQKQMKKLNSEIESGSTQKQMKKLNIISILFNTIFLTSFNLFYILRSKSAFHINNN